MSDLSIGSDDLIQNIDARVKVISTLAFIFFLSLSPAGAWPTYLLHLTAVLAVALLARVGWGTLFKRSLISIPFALAAVPLVFFGREPMANLAVGGHTLAYSVDGLQRFVSIAIRSWISVQAAVLLTATTTPPELLTALQQLGVPKVLVWIIRLTWRYLAVISEETRRMLRARSSRSGQSASGRRAGGTLAWRAAVTGGMAGSLWLRSIDRSERVYAAMLSRGYNGEVPPSEETQLSRLDYGMLVAVVAALALVWLLSLWAMGAG